MGDSPSGTAPMLTHRSARHDHRREGHSGCDHFLLALSALHQLLMPAGAGRGGLDHPALVRRDRCPSASRSNLRRQSGIGQALASPAGIVATAQVGLHRRVGGDRRMRGWRQQRGITPVGQCRDHVERDAGRIDGQGPLRPSLPRPSGRCPAVPHRAVRWSGSNR